MWTWPRTNTQKHRRSLCVMIGRAPHVSFFLTSNHILTHVSVYWTSSYFVREIGKLSNILPADVHQSPSVCVCERVRAQFPQGPLKTTTVRVRGQVHIWKESKCPFHLPSCVCVLCVYTQYIISFSPKSFRRKTTLRTSHSCRVPYSFLSTPLWKPKHHPKQKWFSKVMDTNQAVQELQQQPSSSTATTSGEMVEPNPKLSGSTLLSFLRRANTVRIFRNETWIMCNW